MLLDFMSLNTAMIFVWLGIAIVALIIELNTTDLSSIWATVGGVITAIVAIWCHIIWVQIIIFLVISILGIFQNISTFISCYRNHCIF